MEKRKRRDEHDQDKITKSLKPADEDKKKKRIYNLREVQICLEDIQLAKEVECPICLGPCFEPITLPCQHTVCSVCVSKITVEDCVTCPSCRHLSVKTELIVGRLVKNVVNLLRVHCVHPRCDWTGHYSQLEFHVSESCDRVYKCGCGMVLSKRIKNEHDEQCSMAIVRCECGARVMRSKMLQHLLDECMERELQCPLAKYGCTFNDKRSQLNQHLGICGYEKLWKEVDGLKKQIKFLETSDLINTYKKSDCFISTGLSQKDPVQRSLVQKYAFTVFDLKFPVTLGAINSQDITLFSLLSDSLFQASFSSAKVKSQCQLDINHEEKVLSITLAGIHDRFFIFNRKDAELVKVSRGRGYITIDLPPPPQDDVSVSLMVHAHRRFVQWGDTEEYNFVIEPCHRHFTSFRLKCSKEVSERVFNELDKFFNKH